MIARLIAALTRHDDLEGLEAFHRAELREAGVTDDALRAFVNGR